MLDTSEAQAVYAKYREALTTADITDADDPYDSPPVDLMELYQQQRDALVIEALLNPSGGAILRRKFSGDIEIERFLCSEIDFSYGVVGNTARFKLTGTLMSPGTILLQELQIRNLELQFRENTITIQRNAEFLGDPLSWPIILEFAKHESGDWQIHQIKIDMGRISGAVAHRVGDNDAVILDATTKKCKYRFNGTEGKTLPVELGKWFRIDRTRTYPQHLQKEETEGKGYPYVFIDAGIREERITRLHFAFTRTADNPTQNPKTAILDIPIIPASFKTPTLNIPYFKEMGLMLENDSLITLDALAQATLDTFLLPAK